MFDALRGHFPKAMSCLPGFLGYAFVVSTDLGESIGSGELLLFCRGQFGEKSSRFAVKRNRGRRCGVNIGYTFRESHFLPKGINPR
jgi:hypothetical protein